ncbi:conserved hypothetical protein [Trichinella spiralis]|uniref:hypothetical protein n=1 Tax=Trichinella spiralis TaxID=6334 RepID=UPI0001EFEA91|nr:conserved hypothetical protein [Trichinella spiralis]
MLNYSGSLTSAANKAYNQLLFFEQAHSFWFLNDANFRYSAIWHSCFALILLLIQAFPTFAPTCAYNYCSYVRKLITAYRMIFRCSEKIETVDGQNRMKISLQNVQQCHFT